MPEKPMTYYARQVEVEAVREMRCWGELDSGDVEYALARKIVHLGEHILEGRFGALAAGKKPQLGLRTAKEKFIRPFAEIEMSLLSWHRAEAVRTIKEMANTGDWNDLKFVKKFRARCERFYQG